MSGLIQSREDYAAAMQLVHENELGEWSYDEHEALMWLVGEMKEYEAAIGERFLQEFGASACYSVSEKSFNAIPDSNVYDLTYCSAWLHYRAMRYAGLMDIPF